MSSLIFKTMRSQAKLAAGMASLCVFGLMTGCASTKAPAASASTVTEAKDIKDGQLVASAENGSKVSTDTTIVAPTGLGKIWNYISPYRITIQQGNFISQEQASQLKQGMTREQVRFLLGTALLTDMFHEDRWDYPFRLLKPNGELISSRISIYFKNNTVAKFEGANLPTEKEYLAHITNSAIVNTVESSIFTEGSKKKQ
jgi:outer membrane protein assembly factor BamE